MVFAYCSPHVASGPRKPALAERSRGPAPERWPGSSADVGLVIEEPLVGCGDAIVQRHRGLPPQIVDPADVQQLAAGAVRFGGVLDQFALVADNTCDDLS